MNLYFDEDSQKLIVNAKKEMFKLRHPYVGSEHLLLAILHMDSLEITHVLEKYGITYNSFKNKLIDSVGIGSKANDWFLFTPLLKKILLNANEYVSDSSILVSPYHLLLAIFKEGDGVANRILVSMNIDLNTLYDDFLINNLVLNVRKRKLLDSLAVNMNQKSIDGCYDPVIGRDTQLHQLIRILLRKNKCNPLLLGEAGVGKTAIVEELAHLIAIGQVPLKLKNSTIYSISMADLVAGTKYRGEFEEKIQNLIEEIKGDSSIILFVDEIHTLIGAGGAEGAIDASNILKPYLARGDIKIIGATTVSEYSKCIKNDKAFDRRFQKIYVEEPTQKEIEEILECLVPFYEKFHNVRISKKILLKIIIFSSKYILYGRQPDKAIDLLDEVCVYAVSKDNKNEKLLTQYSTKINILEKEKNNCIIHKDFAIAKKLKIKLEKLSSEYNTLLFSIDSINSPISISEDDLAKVVYFKTNILLGSDWNKKIKDIFLILKKTIYGQNEVLSKLFVDLGDITYISEDRPLSLLFVGKNGLGKTFLSQKLGELLVEKNHCHIFNMNEFKDEQSINKIIGKYRIQFLDSIREKPFSILIFDNIDQAHPNIISFLLEVLNDGKIITYDGEEYNLSKCIFLFTTNILVNNIGFSSKIEYSASLKLLSNKVYNIYYFKSISKRAVKKYVFNYCKDNSISKNNCEILLNEILTNYNYKKYGFSKLLFNIEKNVKNLSLKI